VWGVAYSLDAAVGRAGGPLQKKGAFLPFKRKAPRKGSGLVHWGGDFLKALALTGGVAHLCSRKEVNLSGKLT